MTTCTSDCLFSIRGLAFVSIWKSDTDSCVNKKRAWEIREESCFPPHLHFACSAVFMEILILKSHWMDEDVKNVTGQIPNPNTYSKVGEVFTFATYKWIRFANKMF